MEFLTPFQWSIFAFLIGHAVAVIRFFMWVVSSINTLNAGLIANTALDHKLEKEISELKKEDRKEYKELINRMSDIAQGLVRVETTTEGIQKQFDKL